MTVTIDTLIMVRSQNATLVRAEVRAINERTKLAAAVRDAIVNLGHSIENVSEASGLTPAEIRRILAEPKPIDSDLSALAGLS